MMLPRYVGNIFHIGNGTISGTVVVDGIPKPSMRMLLLEGNRCIRDTLTDNAGYYEFRLLDERLKFDVIAKDPSGLWEAKISTNRYPG